jgi:hypothetical protein
MKEKLTAYIKEQLSMLENDFEEFDSKNYTEEKMFISGESFAYKQVLEMLEELC